MRLAALHWSQQQKDEIDRSTIDGFEIDRLFEPREHTENLRNAHNTRVRNSYALTDAVNSGRHESPEALAPRPVEAAS